MRLPRPSPANRSRPRAFFRRRGPTIQPSKPAPIASIKSPNRTLVHRSIPDKCNLPQTPTALRFKNRTRRAGCGNEPISTGSSALIRRASSSDHAPTPRDQITSRPPSTVLIETPILGNDSIIHLRVFQLTKVSRQTGSCRWTPHKTNQRPGCQLLLPGVRNRALSPANTSGRQGTTNRVGCEVGGWGGTVVGGHGSSGCLIQVTREKRVFQGREGFLGREFHTIRPHHQRQRSGVNQQRRVLLITCGSPSSTEIIARRLTSRAVPVRQFGPNITPPSRAGANPEKR